MMTNREAFEAWISAPPFERDINRKPNDPERVAWPGMYENYEVELAWEAWNAALTLQLLRKVNADD